MERKDCNDVIVVEIKCYNQIASENINGLIRTYSQKGKDFNTIEKKKITYVENWINNRSMKILNDISY